MTIEKAKKILNLVYSEYPSLKDEIINIEIGKEFSVTEFIGVYDISILEEFNKNDTMNKFMDDYLKEEFNLEDHERMFYDFLECFAFMHELGHIYYSDLEDTKKLNIQYMEIKNQVFNSYKQAFWSYRKLEGEHLADSFAMILLRKKLKEIYSIMLEITLEEAIEAIELFKD